MFIDTPDNTIKRIWQRIPTYIKAAFASAFLVGMFCHGYMMANKLPNHDDMSRLYNNNDTWRWGRWFLPIPSAVGSALSLPMINGMLTILYIAVAACLLLACLRITNTLVSVLVAGLMVSFPVTTATFTYMYVVDAYLFALLLACLAVFLAERYKYGFVFAVIPLTLSLGCYQAYFGVAVGLMVMVLLFDTMNSQFDLRSILFKGVKFVGTLVASVLVYLGITRLAVSLRGVELNPYMGIDQMGSISPSSLLSAIGEAYQGVFRFFFTAGDLELWYYHIHNKLAVLLFIAAFVFSGFLLVLWGIRIQIHRDGKRLLLLLALLILLPLGSSAVFLMGSSWKHLLMLYGLVLVLCFPLAVQALYVKKWGGGVYKHWLTLAVNISCWIIVAAMVFGIWNYAVLANKAYLKMTMWYEQDYAHAITLITRIQELPGYSHDKEIILVGQPYQNMEDYQSTLTEFDSFEVIGAYSWRLVGNLFTYDPYLRNYLGLRQSVTNIWYDSEKADVPTVLMDMPQYPAKGSIMIINDKIYVKLS